MNYRASDFRNMSRNALRGRWGKAAIVTFLAILLGVTTTAGSVITFSFDANGGFMLEIAGKSISLIPVGAVSILLAIVLIVWTIVQIVIGGAISLGYHQFHINMVRQEVAEIDTLFVHKNKLWHGFCIGFLQGLYVFLWLLCFIVPGIMAAYSYSLARYIAIDHPEMTAGETLAASKKMMQGHRFRLFCMELSFIGWEFLGGLTLGIGSYFVVPYKETARAFFYQDLLNSGMNIVEEFPTQNPMYGQTPPYGGNQQ